MAGFFFTSDIRTKAFELTSFILFKFSNLIPPSGTKFSFLESLNKLTLVQQNYLKKLFPFQKYVYLNSNFPSFEETQIMEQEYYHSLSTQRKLINDQLKTVVEDAVKNHIENMDWSHELDIYGLVQDELSQMDMLDYMDTTIRIIQV